VSKFKTCLLHGVEGMPDAANDNDRLATPLPL
jgi:hypothetical protein